MSVEIRPATARDADGLVAVVRDGFDPAFQTTMTYGCSGMAQFVRDQLDLPAWFCDSRYTVAGVRERVVGGVDLRAAGGALVLNYISVHPEHRSGGLARRLLAASVEAFPAAGLGVMQLDVLATNRVARQWYERLGFRPASETHWWEVDLGDAPDAGAAVVVHGFPQAQAAHARFGFSQVRLAAPTGTYEVGRLGADWFRLTDAAALADAALLGALRWLDPRRRVLALLPPDADGPGWTLRATTVRMTVPLPALRDRLAVSAVRPS